MIVGFLLGFLTATIILTAGFGLLLWKKLKPVLEVADGMGEMNNLLDSPVVEEDEQEF